MGDHTTGNGYYVYIEASIPQKAGDRAWLVSPMIPATSGSCLVFLLSYVSLDWFILIENWVFKN